MSWTNNQFILSPYAKIRLLPTDGKAKIYNLVNGKTFEVGKAVVEILEALKVPQHYEQLEAKFIAYRSELSNILSFLALRGIISESDKQQEPVIGVTPVQERLFNLENFNPEATGFSIPFVGVP